MAENRIQSLEALLRMDPEDPDLHLLLGKELLSAARFVDAAERLAEAARRNPDLAAIWRFWGEALRGTGDTAGARNTWNAGIEISERTGDLQAGKEMKALLKRLDRQG